METKKALTELEQLITEAILEDQSHFYGDFNTYSLAISLLENNVTIQWHGHWLGEGGSYADGELVYDVWYCSECNNCIDDGTDDPADLPKFCSECGAKMDGAAGTFTGLAATAAADINDGCKWIPVTERLPEPIDDVLVVIHNDMGVTVDMDWRTYDGRWAHNDEFVTHWMPLPDAPR